MFIPHTTDDGRIPPVEYRPAGAITPKLGLALVVSAGKLAVASGSTKPQYICMTEHAAAVESGTIIPVHRVSSEIIYETTASVSIASVNRGNKVTLAADGLKVTATTTEGVAEVVDFDGTTTGSKVFVRFA